jgi:hypothetical protein
MGAHTSQQKPTQYSIMCRPLTDLKEFKTEAKRIVANYTTESVRVYKSTLVQSSSGVLKIFKGCKIGGHELIHVFLLFKCTAEGKPDLFVTLEKTKTGIVMQHASEPDDVVLWIRKNGTETAELRQRHQVLSYFMTSTKTYKLWKTSTQ